MCHFFEEKRKFDEKDFLAHPEWRYVCSPDKSEQLDYENEVHFHALCFNTGYLDVLCSQIEEVMVNYNPCGIFLLCIFLKKGLDYWKNGLILFRSIK